MSFYTTDCSTLFERTLPAFKISLENSTRQSINVGLPGRVL
jgi:hypothetical protein